MDLFKAAQDGDDGKPAFGEAKIEKVGATVLDRVHQSMILFAAGRSDALKRFLVDDGAGNNTRFWTLAQALSALYPNGLKLKLTVEVAPEGGISKQKIEETKAALRELGMNDDLTSK
jgi:putative DNA methylase